MISYERAFRPWYVAACALCELGVASSCDFLSLFQFSPHVDYVSSYDPNFSTPFIPYKIAPRGGGKGKEKKKFSHREHTI